MRSTASLPGRRLAGLLMIIVTIAACAGTDPSPTAGTDGLAGLTQDELDVMLIDAAWQNDIGLAAELIAAGADVNHQDRTQQSAYLIATSEGYLEFLELTLQNGADVASLDSFNGTGLIRAADRGHAAVVDRLLDTGIEVDHINNLGWTALHEAIILGDGGPRYVRTIELLIAAGADVQLRSQPDDTTPLRHAENRGQDEVADIIRAAIDSD